MKILIVLISLFLTGCTSTRIETVPRLDKPAKELTLEPVAFKVIVVDNKVYYALDSENYTNLGLNMLRIEQWIYDAAMWEELNAERTEGAKDY